MDLKKVSQILRIAKEQQRSSLLDTEGLALLEAMDIEVPHYALVRSAKEATAAITHAFVGDQVVIKVVSPDILHKTDVGGVVIVPNKRNHIVSTLEAMEKKFKSARLVGFTINQFVEYDRSLGRELLIGMRWTEDFGPIVNFSAGGIYAEFLAKNFVPGKDVTIFSPSLTVHEEQVHSAVQGVALSEIVTGRFRNQDPLVQPKEIHDLIAKFLSVAPKLMLEGVTEFEVNPFVVTRDKKLMALDILIKLQEHSKTITAPERPIEKIKHLLEPKSAAIIGVSEKMNAGHIILNNLIQGGMNPAHISIIKPNCESIDGCRCYSDVASLPEKVDLFILSVSAAQVPEVVTDIIEYQKAESVIVIPGGLEEKTGTESLVGGMHEALQDSRKTAWGGPVINGGNCLGIRSIPGHYNTLFIPEHKLPIPSGKEAPLALISQSGAFAISRVSKLSAINPRYVISVGNQMDLTVGDYLTYLKDDPAIDIFAVYIEGFRQLDGLKFLKAAHELTEQGKTVILYRAGRTSAGAKASASHTASIAGDYAVTRELCRQAGIIMADSISDFDDLVKVFTYLNGKKTNGFRLGAISNAGCECVAIADNLGQFELATFTEKTEKQLKAVLEKSKISEIVDVHNPLDLTPMAGNDAYEESARAVLEDEQVDAAIIGCVPLSGAITTLAKANHHAEDIETPDSIAGRLIRISAESKKPWVAVVDAGSIYDALARRLDEHGIPTFRAADTALRLFNLYCGQCRNK